MKRTRLRRVSRKRTAALREAGRPLPRSTLPAQSAKRKAESMQRRYMVRRELASRPWCEAKPLIGGEHRCDGRATDIHEPLTRARGGSITDPANTWALCRSCHRFIHDNPEEATRLGLLVPSWKG